MAGHRCPWLVISAVVIRVNVRVRTGFDAHPCNWLSHNGSVTITGGCALAAALFGGVVGTIAGQTLATPGEWISLFDGTSLSGWREAPFSGRAGVQVKDGMIVIGKGRLTGITWTGEFPKSGYEIRFEAARLEGNDFFAGITFPVSGSFCSWINGGWGGSVVGLSSLDGDDASENDTSTVRDFVKGRWYAFRLVVTESRIHGWIDGQPIIDAEITGRRVGLRPGEIDRNIPLGFASYSTAAGLRKIAYRRLSGEGHK